MFKVRLTYCIYAKEKSDPLANTAAFSQATRTTELPFPPFIGLRLDSAHDVSRRSIVRVTWRTDDQGQRFVCDLEDEYPRHVPPDGDYLSYEDHKELAADMGWEVRAFPGEAKR